MLISEAEDHEAHGICVDILNELREGDGTPFTDGFFDYACLQGARKKVTENTRLHRCLQHTKVSWGHSCTLSCFFFTGSSCGGDKKRNAKLCHWYK